MQDEVRNILCEYLPLGKMLTNNVSLFQERMISS